MPTHCTNQEMQLHLTPPLKQATGDHSDYDDDKDDDEYDDADDRNDDDDHNGPNPTFKTSYR